MACAISAMRRVEASNSSFGPLVAGLSTLSSLATEFVNLQVDIIVALPTTAGIAARQATTEIPIVVEGGDLEAAGLVTSLAHPGDWCKCDSQ